MIDTMPKKINYTLSNRELLTIEQAIKNHPDLRLRERARMIRLLHQGYTHEEIGDLLAISDAQVYYWHKRWREEGLEGLSDKPRSGRPPVGTEELKAELEKLLATNPQDLGYVFTVWNLPRLQAYLDQELGVSMHVNTLRSLLSEMDYVYRRPKHDLANLQDPEAKAAAQEMLDELKKKPAQAKSNYSLWTKQP
jgi:putative transposase